MNPEIARKFIANQETGTGVSNDKLGMWIFLASEVIFFAVLIAGVFVLRLRNLEDWAIHKEAGTATFLATVNTFILIMSSVFVVSAIDAIQRGKEQMMKLWLWLTLIGGCIFLFVQSLEWAELEHGLHEIGLPAGIVGGAQESIFASGFYTLTGFHGTHVAIGVLLLIYVLIRAHRGDFTPRQYNALEMWGLYWHFVDLVWIILFTILYLL
ncbi:MAG: heme-copper oxidase subunit III [Ardenticatenales bacterium]|nr:heme-copper oxidase subunit III [Ardenticatenales bacterium]